jgi:type 1 glutamine amidotransferase
MNRRQWLQQAGLASLLLSAGGLQRSRAADARKHRILMYTRSQGFQHSVVTRKDDKLSLAEQIVTDLGPKHNFEVVCAKDGRVFESADFPKFDGFLFETQGDLLQEKSRDGTPPMSLTGKKALLEAVASGKGFIGCHCASDTFHTRGDSFQNQEQDKRDPYIAMVGGEFIKHGPQQKGWMRVVDPRFPGLGEQKDFEINEEWYSLKNFAPDLHVILVQDTKGMKSFEYERPSYPATWARQHGKGRVFYTSMGHREDVWQSTIFQTLLVGALAWTLGEVNADITPNLASAAPQASELPKKK